MTSSHPTVLATLVDRFGTSPENLATEALNYILERSPAARRAMVDIAFPSMPLDDRARLTLTFRTQVAGADGSIPDLVGFDGDHRKALIIEAKFWAGLTDSQPVAYLNQLPTDRNATLLVIAPSMRFETLWPELIRRARVANESGASDHTLAGSGRVVRVGKAFPSSERSMMLVSWATVLGAIESAARATGEYGALEDVRQLQSLCERQDTDAFLPIRSKELSEVTPRRMMQFIGLVDDLHARLKMNKKINTKGLSLTYRKYQQGYYARFSWSMSYIHIDLVKWSTLRATPIWLRLYGPTWNGGAALVRDRLSSLAQENPSRMLADIAVPDKNVVAIPLFPKFSCERTEVLRDLYDQADQIHSLLGEAPDAGVSIHEGDTGPLGEDGSPVS